MQKMSAEPPRGLCRAGHVQDRGGTELRLEGCVGTRRPGRQASGPLRVGSPVGDLSESRGDGVQARAPVEVQVRPSHAQIVAPITRLASAAEMKCPPVMALAWVGDSRSAIRHTVGKVEKKDNWYADISPANSSQGAHHHSFMTRRLLRYSRAPPDTTS